MKTVLSATFAALLALPLVAQNDPQTPAAVPDSPLVAAAKASSAARSGKKASTVITNDNLARTGGHMATTDVTTSVTGVPTGTPSASNSRAEADTKAKREADAAKLKLLKDDPLAFYKQYGGDKPAYQGATTTQPSTATVQTPATNATAMQLQQAATTQPASATTKQPQSTAKTVTPGH